MIWYCSYPTYSEDISIIIFCLNPKYFHKLIKGHSHYKSKQDLKWQWYSQMSVLTINRLFNCHWCVAKTHQKYPKPCQTFKPGTFLINNKGKAMDSCVLTKLFKSVSDNHGFWNQKITGCYVILLWRGFRFRFLLRFFVLHKSS